MAEIEEHEALEQVLNEKEQVQQIDEVFDFDGQSDEDLLLVLKKMSTDSIATIEKKVNSIKEVFFDRYKTIKKVALEKYMEEGGVRDDFEFRDIGDVNEIKVFISKYSEQIKGYYSDKKEQLIANLKKKESLLSALREIVHADEDDQTFNKVKKIQEEWKETGDVPSNKMGDLYPNYRALLDIFYNNRSLFFELKDLDRKKNFEVKVKLVDDAEELLKMTSAKEMLTKLKELHAAYKNAGPIPKEHQEPLWERLKQASQKVYDYKDKVNAEFLGQLNENLIQKKQLIEQLEELKSFSSTVINEWKVKTDEVLAIQKLWKEVGAVPRAASKEISKSFWGAGKEFFNAKSAFFKTLDEKREKAYESKLSLCEKVEALSEIVNIGEACHQAINIQKEWKKLGPAPKAVNDKVYDRFRSACDVLFDKRRSVQDEADKVLLVNFEAKQKLYESAEEIFEAGVSQEVLTAFFVRWNEYGEVPQSQRKELNAQVQDKLNKLIKAKSNDDIELLRSIVEVELLKGDRNIEKILFKKVAAVRKKISELEDDISNGENNLLFFKSSKSFEALKRDFESKADNFRKQIKSLKQQLRVLRNN